MAASLLLLGCDQAAPSSPPRAPAAQAPRWAIVADPTAGIWRLNEQTGEVLHCTFGADLAVHCFAAPIDAGGVPTAYGVSYQDYLDSRNR